MQIHAVRQLSAHEIDSCRPKRPMETMKAFHHMVARLFAQGHKYTDIARVVGRSPPTIKNWLETPANAELVEQFRGEVDDEIKDQMGYRLELRRRAAILSLERLVERLESGEEIADRTLLAIVADSDDRTGLARTETRVNLNASIGAQLDRAAKRVKAMRAKIAAPKTETLVQDKKTGTYGLERRI